MTTMDYELDLSALNISIDPVKTLKPFYRVTRKLSMTEYGAVFLAQDCNQNEYAIKFQKVFYKNARLLHERNILDRLHSADPLGFPKVFNYVSFRDHEFLVMQRMGPSLQDLLEKTSTGKLSKKSVIMFGIQAVRRIQVLHENHVLHRDIRPASFVIGSEGHEGIICLIGFGISTTVDDWSTYNPDGPSVFCGTLPFASSEALLEKRPTRAGDLESLVYTLILLFTGELPFYDPHTNDEFYDAVCKQIAQRQQQNIYGVCVKFPELINFTRLAFDIEERDEPNYNALVSELERVLNQNGYQNDGRFDWM